MLGHFHEVFPGVGVVFALPEDGGDVFGDVSGQAPHTVALDEGHHVVFQREKIICAHTLKGSFSQMGGGAGRGGAAIAGLSAGKCASLALAAVKLEQEDHPIAPVRTSRFCLP